MMTSHSEKVPTKAQAHLIAWALCNIAVWLKGCWDPKVVRRSQKYREMVYREPTMKVCKKNGWILPGEGAEIVGGGCAPVVTEAGWAALRAYEATYGSILPRIVLNHLKDGVEAGRGSTKVLEG